MDPFKKSIEIRWQDCDANGHVRHSAYYDFGAHARIRFFTENQFSPSQMSTLGIGPIIFKEECTFLKEIKMEETIQINVLKGDFSADGSKWVLHHEIFNQKGQKAAHISLSGAWLDLQKRKLTIPPKKIAEMIHLLPKGEYFTFQKNA